MKKVLFITILLIASNISFAQFDIDQLINQNHYIMLQRNQQQQLLRQQQEMQKQMLEEQRWIETFYDYLEKSYKQIYADEPNWRLVIFYMNECIKIKNTYGNRIGIDYGELLYIRGVAFLGQNDKNQALQDLNQAYREFGYTTAKRLIDKLNN